MEAMERQLRAVMPAMPSELPLGKATFRSWKLLSQAETSATTELSMMVTVPILWEERAFVA